MRYPVSETAEVTKTSSGPLETIRDVEEIKSIILHFALRWPARSHQHQPQPPAQYPSARLASASASSSVAAAAAAAVGRGGRRDAAFETVFGTPRGGGQGDC